MRQTYLHDYTRYFARTLRVPREIAFMLADMAVACEQPRGRVLCACNQTWMRLALAQSNPMALDASGHGFDDCRK